MEGRIDGNAHKQFKRPSLLRKVKLKKEKLKMADYEDKGSQIRVTNLEAFPMGVKAYVKIETNMGVTGWGEINNMETDRHLCIGALLVGTDYRGKSNAH